MAAAGGYLSTAYYYNLNRFQFDANQKQNSAHQGQNMKIAQWNLFREDVKDLFSLTSTTGTTYTSSAILIVAAACNFIWTGYKDYPMDLPWLLVIWNMCNFGCILFGLASIWLATHGAISSTSASTKILTQAVRPPIPSLSQIDRVRLDQDDFEKAGMDTLFKMPRFLRFSQHLHQGLDAMSEFSFKEFVRGLRGLPPTASATHGSIRVRRKLSCRRGTLLPVEAAQSSHYNQVVELLNDRDGGPGRSAISSAHFWLLRQVQKSFACFDAYARICLVICAQQFLFSCGYFAMGHFMSKEVHSTAHNPHAAYFAVGIATVGSICLFRMDLFLCTPQLRRIQLQLISGPLCTCIAIHFANIRTNQGRGGKEPGEQIVSAYVPWVFASLACLGHLGWIWTIYRIAQPAAGVTGLPNHWRFSHYLDALGWQRQQCSTLLGDVSMEDGDSVQPHAARAITCLGVSTSERGSALRQACQLNRTIQRLLKEEVAQHLTPEEVLLFKTLEREMHNQVENLTAASTEDDDTLPTRRISVSRQQSVAGDTGSWLQCERAEYDERQGSFWVNTLTGEVATEPPSVGRLIDLSLISTSVRVLQNRLQAEDRIAGRTAREHLKDNVDVSMFDLLPERPDSATNQKNVPWKSFTMTLKMVSYMWIVALVVVSMHPNYFESPLAKRERFNRATFRKIDDVAYPHNFFRPSALTCGRKGRTMLMADSFGVYVSDLPNTSGNSELEVSLRDVQLKRVMLTANLSTPWAGFGILSDYSDQWSSPKSLLMLEKDGRVVVEYVHGKGRSKYATTRWSIGEIVDANLTAIEPMQEEDAEICKEGVGKAQELLDLGWGLYAATDYGAVIILCPAKGNLLKPVHKVTSFQRKQLRHRWVSVYETHSGKVTPFVTVIIGLHVSTITGTVWILRASSLGTEILAFAMQGGRQIGRWDLPTARRWAAGLCALKGGRGMLLAGVKVTSPMAKPEIWHLRVRKHSLWQ
jgi:hypothetical protein